MSFNFINQTDKSIIAGAISTRLSQLTQQHGSVCWFLSGGSCIELEVMAARKLLKQNTSSLKALLIDERYGPANHPESNYKQLLDAGFPKDKIAFTPVLSDLPAAETTDIYNDTINTAANGEGYWFAVLGMGADGHTAGILPHSEPLASNDMVSHYVGPDHQRITLTPRALARMNEAVVYAVGQAKQKALASLAQSLSPSAQPAQLLKTIPGVTIYNEQMEAKI